ncbi:beta family protein [Rhodoplanes serenus]|uniref:beta family protein n=1 Tax=Rhodoplanes serenus TaxID=200615 RepID=UPI000DADC8D9|nr:hypothetical protein CH340_01845 [Rhodoplanes serenus]
MADNLGVGTGRRYRYVPTLRTKAGEVAALANLVGQAKQRTLPIFLITPKPAASFTRELAAAWSGSPVVLDGSGDAAATNSAANFNSLFSSLGQGGVPAIPLVEAGGVPTHIAAALSAQNRYGPGLVLRVNIDDLPNAVAWAAAHSVIPSRTDLLIDCGHIADVPPTLIAAAVGAGLNNHPLNGWLSVTLSSSAAPKDVSNLQPGPNLVPRRDWALWSALTSSYPMLHYGDYAIAHRDLSEPPGFAMANATVSPRYCLDNDWYIRKGRSTRGANGQPMAAQYHGHAAALSQHAQFGGLTGCWGDAHIVQIARQAGVGRSGSRETWVSIGVNRHISLVCDRLP